MQRAPCRVDDAQHAEITERPASTVPQVLFNECKTIHDLLPP